MNGLNVLSEDQDKVLKALELIKDSELKRKLIETLIRDNSETPKIIEAPYQLSEVLNRFQQSNTKETPVSISDLKREVNFLKSEISDIKQNNSNLSRRLTLLETKFSDKDNNLIKDKNLIEESTSNEEYLHLLNQVTSQKWFVKITLVIDKNFILKDEIALIDSGADLNCIKEGIIPTKARPAQMNNEYLELCKKEINLISKVLRQLLLLELKRWLYLLQRPSPSRDQT